MRSGEVTDFVRIYLESYFLSYHLISPSFFLENSIQFDNHFRIVLDL